VQATNCSVRATFGNVDAKIESQHSQRISSRPIEKAELAIRVCVFAFLVPQTGTLMSDCSQSQSRLAATPRGPYCKL
jgi:ubiquitin